MKSDTPTEKPSIQRISELQRLIADFSQIKRHLNLADTGRRENDAEHSFGLALTSWFLATQIAPHLSLEKILKYAIAHDIVEIHAGDTFVFDAAKVSTKEKREKEALKQIEADWPDFPEMSEYARRYMEKADDEAKFVYTVDKILPPLMVRLGEAEKFWKRNKITKQMHIQEKRSKMKYCPELQDYAKLLADYLPDELFYQK